MQTRKRAMMALMATGLGVSAALPISDAASAVLRVVVDNQSGGFSTTGEWLESGAGSEFRGSSIYAMDDATATWTAKQPESGVYRVQAW